MMIQLPDDVESSINMEVRNGHFASVDDAIAEAWRAFLRQQPPAGHPAGPGSIGAMRDAAEELDEAVEHAMSLRQQPWRIPADE